MSQAEELLNLLSETIPEHTHPVVDSDSYFLIDPATRKIENTSRKDLVLMQRDHNSERYTFQLPRYIEGHDMSLCNRVKCHFNNIEYDAETNTYIEHPDLVELTDLRVNPEDETSVICSWLITRQSTWYEGTLGFFLQYLCVDDEGNETYEWNTDEFTAVTVNKTKHHDEAAILEYTAIFEQWRERIFGAGDSVKSELIALTEEKLSAVKTEGSKQVESVNSIGAAQVEAISNEGLRVLNTIPEDYTAVSEQTAMLTKLAGPVIRQETEGETIAVKDSAKMPLLGLHMFGKSSQKTTKGYQLFDASKLETRQMSNHTVTNNGDGSLTISSTEEVASEHSGYFRDYTHEETLQLLKKAGTYTAVFGDTTNPYMYISLRNTSGALAEMTNRNMVTSSREITEEMLADETSYLRLGVYISSGSTVKTGTIKPMLYIDGDGTWEPFTGGQSSPNPEYPQEIESVNNSTLSVGGKNLFSVSKCDLITVGASGTKRYGFEWDIPGTYTFSCHADTDVTAVAYKIYENGVYGPFTSVTEDVEFTVTLTEGQHLIVYKGPENEHFTYGLTNIQLEYGTVATEYESYVSEQTTSSSIELPGIPVSSGGNYTDKNGQQYIANYRDWERGVDVDYTNTIELDASTDEYWYTINATGGVIFAHAINDALAKGSSKNLYCTHFAPSVIEAYNKESNSCYFYDKTFRVCHLGVNTLDEFKEWLSTNHIKLTYPLATPIETPIPEAELQAYRALRTNYPNTTILNDSGAYMKLAYATDTKMYIDNKFEELKNAIVNNS